MLGGTDEWRWADSYPSVPPGNGGLAMRARHICRDRDDTGNLCIFFALWVGAQECSVKIKP